MLTPLTILLILLTNNEAERSSHSYVLWRKGSYVVWSLQSELFRQRIRYNHHVLSASRSSVKQFWTITAFKKDRKETIVIAANFL